MMGLALKNAVFTVKDGGGKKVFAEQGEILFTHFGISGPLALSASAHMRPDPAAYSAEIDMKCALDGQTLDRRILSDLSESPAKALINSLGRTPSLVDNRRGREAKRCRSVQEMRADHEGGKSGARKVIKAFHADSAVVSPD